ncbi:MAG: hypothetical protein E6G06_09915 [Actinobacteria bacterium]|nr:MAG: hypothetical protein E6G06_09915 [Actinomycetota bacterium]
MIGWGQIFYGAALTTIVTALVFVFVRRERSRQVLIPALAAALLGPITWNAVLHRAGGNGFFVDIPFKPFPISWQDTVDGIVTFAVASVFLGIALRREPSGRVISLAALVAAVALLVDVYCY